MEGTIDKEGISDGKLVVEGASDTDGALEKVGTLVGFSAIVVGFGVNDGTSEGAGVGAGEDVGF